MTSNVLNGICGLMVILSALSRSSMYISAIDLQERNESQHHESSLSSLLDFLELTSALVDYMVYVVDVFVLVVDIAPVHRSILIVFFHLQR